MRAVIAAWHPRAWLPQRKEITQCSLDERRGNSKGRGNKRGAIIQDGDDWFTFFYFLQRFAHCHPAQTCTKRAHCAAHWPVATVKHWNLEMHYKTIKFISDWEESECTLTNWFQQIFLGWWCLMRDHILLDSSTTNQLRPMKCRPQASVKECKETNGSLLQSILRKYIPSA